MPSDIITYCLVSLLSQGADQQAQEMDALLNDQWEHTHFASCLRAYGENVESAAASLVATAKASTPKAADDDTVIVDANDDLQTMTAGFGDKPPRKVKKIGS